MGKAMGLYKKYPLKSNLQRLIKLRVTPQVGQGVLKIKKIGQSDVFSILPKIVKRHTVAKAKIHLLKKFLILFKIIKTSLLC